MARTSLYNLFGPMLLLAAAGVGADPRFPVRLTVFDQIARPGEGVSLAVKLEQAGIGPWHPDLTGRCLSSSHGAAARTGRDGGGIFTAQFPPETPSPLPFDVCFEGDALHRPVTGVGRVFLWDDQCPILVTDIDNTISDRLLVLVPVTPISRNPPLPGAPEVLTKLAQRYRIVYLTCRPAWLHNKTRKWLAAYGFPEGPLFCRNFRLGQSQEEYKREFLCGLKARYPNLAVGVGNTDSDAGAYGSVHLQTILIDPKGKVGDEACRVVKDWYEVGAILLGEPPPP